MRNVTKTKSDFPAWLFRSFKRKEKKIKKLFFLSLLSPRVFSREQREKTAPQTVGSLQRAGTSCG